MTVVGTGGGCTMQGLMGAVPVVEQLELTQCVHQVGLIPDQRPIQQLAPAGPVSYTHLTLPTTPYV